MVLVNSLGQHYVLIDQFDREFVESQEAVGLAVMGDFRDLDDPDRWVSLRGLERMDRRASGLPVANDSPVRHRHRIAANATMVESGGVPLLQTGY